MSGIDPQKKKNFNEYLDELMPAESGMPHPYHRFRVHEIVRHPELGYGIVTAFKMPDLERELEGLSIQFVNQGKMGDHKVFTPRESLVLETTGFFFDLNRHEGMTLEAVVKLERGDAPLPGLR